ncbi:AAA family ATPase [Egbenema bharatensis]|uniref:AAA family ATPase n=1 Tax=Egbenema bharatensis TaxID=3463334 RepID=UPI003A8B1D6C
MTIDPSDISGGFADNWAYLRTELRWLDQVLMMAVARQRKETHDVERLSQSKADRATSAWWKGIITTEGKAVYDEHRQPQSGVKASYHQQLETRIQSSLQKGVLLALPALRDRLKLTLFEKNLVLMSLAPEVNRRYARLYRYLQGDDLPSKTDLPTLDLVLRLMCRNDSEWRSARHRLVSASPLIQLNLLQFSPQANDSLLNYPLKLSTSVVNYLLAEQPTPESLEALLQKPIALPPASPQFLRRSSGTADWADLVLPESLRSTLHHCVQQIQGQAEAEKRWGILPQSEVPGAIALLMGARGTGKTLAANVMARSLQSPLYQVDLGLIEPEDYPQLLKEIAKQAPAVLLIKSAHHWIGRSGWISPTAIRQFLTQRRQVKGLTLLTVDHAAAVPVQWRQSVDQVVSFPLPNPDDRLQLWQRAFPAKVPLSQSIDWERLAQVGLSGGEILKLAQAAMAQAAAVGADQIEMAHLATVLAQKGKAFNKKAASKKASSQKVSDKTPTVANPQPAPEPIDPEPIDPELMNPKPTIEPASDAAIEHLPPKSRKSTRKKSAN